MPGPTASGVYTHSSTPPSTSKTSTPPPTDTHRLHWLTPRQPRFCLYNGRPELSRNLPLRPPHDAELPFAPATPGAPAYASHKKNTRERRASSENYENHSSEKNDFHVFVSKIPTSSEVVTTVTLMTHRGESPHPTSHLGRSPPASHHVLRELRFSPSVTILHVGRDPTRSRRWRLPHAPRQPKVTQLRPAMPSS